MKKLHSLIASLLAVVVAATAPAFAAQPKPFYDSKSWIVNVAGPNAQNIKNSTLGAKVEVINNVIGLDRYQDSYTAVYNGNTLARQMTENGIGKSFINALTDNGTSQALLQKLALKNAQIQDYEMGNENLLSEGGVQNLIADNYLPILMHNYIYLTYRHYLKDKDGNYKVNKKTGQREYIDKYALFRVVVTPEQAYDIMNCLGNPEKYAKLSFPVKFVYSGNEADLESDVSKHIPDLALRGVLLQRNPAKISIGKKQGVKKGDLVSIYSQRQDKDGNYYSKRISRARVGKVWQNEAQVNFENKLAGNRKNGDVVVRTPDNHFRISLLATAMQHNYGLKILMDTKSSFMRSGLINHFLANVSYSVSDHPGRLFASTKYFNTSGIPEQYYAPQFLNVGIGYGLSKTFLGYLDIMPFFMAQADFSLMFFKNDKDFYEKYESHSPSSISLRVPVGLRFCFNIHYPFKLALEAGWAFRFGGGDGYKTVNRAMESMDMKRDGLFVNLGFVF